MGRRICGEPSFSIRRVLILSFGLGITSPTKLEPNNGRPRTVSLFVFVLGDGFVSKLAGRVSFPIVSQPRLAIEPFERIRRAFRRVEGRQNFMLILTLLQHTTT